MNVTRMLGWTTMAAAAATAIGAARLRGTPLLEAVGAECLPDVVALLAVLAAGCAVQVLVMRRQLLLRDTAPAAASRPALTYLEGGAIGAAAGASRRAAPHRSA